MKSSIIPDRADPNLLAAPAGPAYFNRLSDIQPDTLMNLNLEIPMVSVTMTLGALLSLIGVIAYAVTGMVSVTALIPTFFGIPLMILAQLGKAEERRKMTMHIAVVITLLGFLGSVSGIPQAITLMTGGEVALPSAAIVRSLIAIICLVHVVLSVRSFIEARRAG